MTCCDLTRREWPRASTDFLRGTVTANATLDEQDVAISLDDGTTWIDSEWVGNPGTTRSWQAYLTPDLLPAAITVEVLVRVQDDTDPQEPLSALIPAGTITFT